MRLIDADELMEHAWRDKLDSRELIAKMIKQAPTVKEIPTKIPIDIFEKLASQEPCDVPDINDGNIYECPCGYGWDKSKVVRHHFCPNCGRAVNSSYNSIKTELMRKKMAMELVIKIPEESYKATCNGCMLPPDVENVVQGIKNGIPLPKGHGDLIDVNKKITVPVYDEQYEEWGEEILTVCEVLNKWSDEGINIKDVVIPADSSESEG